jgi:hypothetical protein
MWKTISKCIFTGFTTVSRTALGLTQLPIQWVPRTLSLGVKQPGREVDHSPPSSAKAKKWVVLHLHSPNTLSWYSAQLKKHRDEFTFTFIFTGCATHITTGSNVGCQRWATWTDHYRGCDTLWRRSCFSVWQGNVLWRFLQYYFFLDIISHCYISSWCLPSQTIIFNFICNRLFHGFRTDSLLWFYTTISASNDPV